LCEPVTGAETGVSVATEHPVNTETIKSMAIRLRQAPAAAASRLVLVSDRGALLRPRRLRGIELPIALLDAASPLVPRNGSADMVRANSLARGGNFSLRFAGGQGKDVVIETRGTAVAASWFCGGRALAPA
jgi:hypothetical protein